MVWWGVACVLHSGLKCNCLQIQGDTWSRVLSGLFPFEAQQCRVLWRPCTAQSSLAELCACCLLQGSAVSQTEIILCLELGGSAGAPGEYLLCRLLCNITLKLVQLIFTFPVNWKLKIEYISSLDTHEYCWNQDVKQNERSLLSLHTQGVSAAPKSIWAYGKEGGILKSGTLRT